MRLKTLWLLIGKGSKTKVNGNVQIQSNLDHRIAMSFLCLGLISENPIKVKDTDTINSSFPFFLRQDERNWC